MSVFLTARFGVACGHVFVLLLVLCSCFWLWWSVYLIAPIPSVTTVGKKKLPAGSYDVSLTADGHECKLGRLKQNLYKMAQQVRSHTKNLKKKYKARTRN